MQVLHVHEIGEVSGGVAPAVTAAAVLAGFAIGGLAAAFAVGVYIGYQDAKIEASKT